MRTPRPDLPESSPSSAAPSHATLQEVPPPAGLGEPVRSNDLLKGQKTVDIEHNGAVYRLQATRLGKLILTK
jgi:hemin uptake protein HemP